MPRSVLENENSRGICLGCKISGAGNGTPEALRASDLVGLTPSSRFAKNSPLGCFSNANRPHRFEPRFVPENKKAKVHYLG